MTNRLPIHRALALSALAALAAAVAIASAPAASDAAPRSKTVLVKDDFYTPKRAVIRKGGTVTWKWRGKDKHDVIGRGWKSKTMKRGSYSVRFSRVGTYNYLCSLHAGMKGKVIVRRR